MSELHIIIGLRNQGKGTIIIYQCKASDGSKRLKIPDCVFIRNSRTTGNMQWNRLCGTACHIDLQLNNRPHLFTWTLACATRSRPKDRSSCGVRYKVIKKAKENTWVISEELVLQSTLKPAIRFANFHVQYEQQLILILHNKQACIFITHQNRINLCI
jgi:hypothetical protein